MLCESYYIVWNRECGEWCMDRFLVMETMYTVGPAYKKLAYSESPL